MQELIDWLKDENSTGSLGDKVLSLLEKEKEQLMDTAIEFSMHGLEMATRNAEEYYNSL